MNKRIFKKNKKATVGDPMVDFWSYIVFIFIIIIFFVLLTFQNKTREDLIKSDADNLDISNMGINYLRTPINFDNKEMTMSDLIISLEEDFIKMRNEGKSTKMCRINAQEMPKYSDKCKFLIKKTQEMFEKQDDKTSEPMTQKRDKITTYYFVYVYHLSEKDYNKIKEKEKYDYDAFIKLKTESLVSSKADIGIDPPSRDHNSADCIGQKLPLHNKDMKNEQIRFMFCEYKVKDVV